MSEHQVSDQPAQQEEPSSQEPTSSPPAQDSAGHAGTAQPSQAQDNQTQQEDDKSAPGSDFEHIEVAQEAKPEENPRAETPPASVITSEAPAQPDTDTKEKELEEEKKRVKEIQKNKDNIDKDNLSDHQDVVSSTQEPTTLRPSSQKPPSSKAPRRFVRGYSGGIQNYGLTYLPYKSNFEPSEDARRRADEFFKTLKL